MKFLLNGIVLAIILLVLTILSLFIGVSKVSITDIFHLTLALAGLIMQQMMQNKFVSPTTAGTMEWAKLGILLSMIFFPQENIIIKLIFAVVLSIAGTFLFVKLVQYIRFTDVIFIPLLGIMLGGIVSSFATFIALRTNKVQSIGNWLNGNFAIITSGRYEILYLSIPLLILTYIFANHFTIRAYCS